MDEKKTTNQAPAECPAPNFENYPELDADTTIGCFDVEPIQDEEAVAIFKTAVRELLKTRTADEIRGFLEAALVIVELDDGEAA